MQLDILIPACQKAHWKAHKPLCRSLQGGTWAPFKVTLDFESDGQKQGYAFHIDNRKPISTSDLKSQVISIKDAAPPPNVHGTKPFLVKIQRPLVGGVPGTELSSSHSMFVYDRQRSFKLHFYGRENPELYNKTYVMIANESSCNGVKMYRWARRSDDWTLEICLDKVPDEIPKW